MQEGPPLTLYEQPANLFVAEFIGTMNRLTGSMNNGRFICKAGGIAWPEAPANAIEILFRPEDIRVVEGDETTGLQGKEPMREVKGLPAGTPVLSAQAGAIRDGTAVRQASN